MTQATDTIGQQIAAARARKGLSIERTADAVTALGRKDERGKPLRVTSAALSRIERGDRLPGFNSLTALAVVLEVWVVIDPDGDVTLSTGTGGQPT